MRQNHWQDSLISSWGKRKNKPIETLHRSDKGRICLSDNLVSYTNKLSSSILSERQIRPFITIDARFRWNYLLPVEPNPPVPRTVSDSSSTSSKSTFKNGAITIWAIRSLGSTTLASDA